MMIKIIHAYCGLVALKVLKVTVLIGYRFPFAENHQDHTNEHFVASTYLYLCNEFCFGSKRVLKFFHLWSETQMFGIPCVSLDILSYLLSASHQSFEAFQDEPIMIMTLPAQTHFFIAISYKSKFLVHIGV